MKNRKMWLMVFEKDFFKLWSILFLKKQWKNLRKRIYVRLVTNEKIF